MNQISIEYLWNNAYMYMYIYIHAVVVRPSFRKFPGGGGGGGGGGGHYKIKGARLFSVYVHVYVSIQFLGGSGWHAPPGNFCILDSLWCTLRHYILLVLAFVYIKVISWLYAYDMHPLPPLPPPPPPPQMKPW